ncbi:MAG: TatD family hydrolase [Candidatus Omnitrophota bacterium]
MTGLIDTHLQLDFPEFDPDRDAVVARAQAAGVSALITIGTDLEGTRRALELTRRYPQVYAAGGIHPHEAGKAVSEDIPEIARILAEKKFVAVGEVGLDFYRDETPRAVQEAVFVRFLAVQQEVAKPLVIHCREAFERTEELLRAHRTPPWEGVMHCFTGTAEHMKRFLDLGFYISFAGMITYPRSNALREACRTCPAGRLLLETDAPYLAPQSVRGKRNEPAFVLETAREVARVRGVEFETLAAETTANACRLFRIPEGGLQ